jgi:hypothetical protein
MMSTRRSGRRRSRGSFGGGRRGKSLIIYGSIFFAIGLVITIGTYAAADGPGGGTYIVSWGPMVGGLVAIIRGAVHVVADRRAMAQPSPLMPGTGFGMPGPGSGQPGYGGPGFASAGVMPPGYTGPGFAAPGYAGPGYGMPGSAVPGSAGPGNPGPGQGFGAPAAGGPGFALPGFTPAPGFTPQGGPGTPGPGWFADPQDPVTLRWWDGQAWTTHTQPTAYTNPVGQAPSAVPGYPAGPAN